MSEVKCPNCNGDNFKIKNVMTIGLEGNPAAPELECLDCGAETRRGRWVIDIPHPQGSINMQVYLDSPEYAAYLENKGAK